MSKKISELEGRRLSSRGIFVKGTPLKPSQRGAVIIPRKKSFYGNDKVNTEAERFQPLFWLVGRIEEVGILTACIEKLEV